MPSSTPKQHNFMAMVANDPEAAKRTGVPQSVGQEFTKADKGKKFGSSRADLQRINKPKTLHGKSAFFKQGGPVKEPKAMVGKELAFMKAKGAPKKMIKHEAAEMGKTAKYSRGGGIETRGKPRGKVC